MPLQKETLSTPEIEQKLHRGTTTHRALKRQRTQAVDVRALRFDLCHADNKHHREETHISKPQTGR